MKGFDDTEPTKGIEWSRPKVLDDKHKAIEKLLLRALNTPCKSEYKPSLRISSLPICGLLYAQALLKYEKGERKDEQLKDTFYTDVGTATHSFFQRIFPLSDVKDKVWGDWKCVNCSEIMYKAQTTPKSLICPNCRKNHPTIVYEEITVSYRGITGHCDMLFKNNDNTYTLIDFKTTSAYNIKEPKYLPQVKHLHQIQSYSFLLQNQYNIKIKDYFLIYLSRDKCDGGGNKLEHTRPIGFNVTEKTLRRRKEQLDKIVKSRKIIKQLFSNPTIELLKELDDNRPCKSLHDWENSQTGMKAAFFGDEVCPYLENCISKKKISRAARDLWDLIE